jgi:DNA repair protein SbcC/Rad50
MSVKFIHTADLHWSRENKEKAIASLDTLIETGRRENVDLFVLAGDLYDRGIQNSDRDGFPELLDAIQEMLDLAPVVAIQGTLTHDLPGCYEPLTYIQARHSFTLLEPGNTYGYYKGHVNQIEYIDEPLEQIECLLFALPEPSKGWLLAGLEGVGRDELNGRMRDALREILLGYGAIRRQNDGIPAILVYHGMVLGAEACNGQLMTGDIGLSEDDFSLSGADYIAAGHIHEPQDIGRSIHFAGSTFPVNWGELTQKSFRLVTIEGAGGVISTYAIPFPHAPRKKITLAEGEQVKPDEIKGFQVWIEKKGRKEALDALSVDAMLRELMDFGAVEGSRVTLSPIPEETVRAGAITDQTHLRDKITTWAELTGLAVPDGVLSKADGLELAAEGGMDARGAWIRLRSLRLRGATGIKHGRGLDEVFVNFDDYDNGLIALTWPNGGGKTTLIENMHPYACMLTRDGKLQDHFCLRDSFRELIFTDEKIGVDYKAVMLIDGVNPSGKAEYYLSMQDPSDGKWIPATNGKKEDYERAINGLFGPIELFQRSAFVSQKPTKNNPDLADATKGEKKELFRNLAGLDYLQDHAEAAKERRQAAERAVADDSIRVTMLEAEIGKKATLQEEIEATTDFVEQATATLRGLEIEGKDAADKAELARGNIETNRGRINESARLEAEGLKLRADADRLNGEIEAAQAALTRKDEASKTLQSLEDLKALERSILSEKSKHDTETTRLTAAWGERVKEVGKQREVLNRDINAASITLAGLKRDKKTLLRDIDNLLAELNHVTICPNCGHKWADDQENKQKKVADNQERVLSLDLEIVKSKKALNALNARAMEIKDPECAAIPPFDTRALESTRGEIRRLEGSAGQARHTLDLALKAETTISANSREIKRIMEQLLMTQAKWDAVKKLIDPEAESKYKEAAEALEAAREAYAGQNRALAGHEATLDGLKKRMGEIAGKEEELDEIGAKIATAKAESADWAFLERACGPDGIQALELDALAPSISAEANKLLEVSPRPSMSVSFETTRIAGKGSRSKQVEDFLIFVNDSEAGTRQELSTLSEGEKVWIIKALYDAFGVIRAKNTGTKFLTVFMDECDGALDPNAKLAYFRMVQAAHEQAGRRHTIVITHSESAQEMISQRIELNGQGGKEAAA